MGSLNCLYYPAKNSENVQSDTIYYKAYWTAFYSLNKNMCSNPINE